MILSSLSVFEITFRAGQSCFHSTTAASLLIGKCRSSPSYLLLFWLWSNPTREDKSGIGALMLYFDKKDL